MKNVLLACLFMVGSCFSLWADHSRDLSGLYAVSGYNTVDDQNYLGFVELFCEEGVYQIYWQFLACPNASTQTLVAEGVGVEEDDYLFITFYDKVANMQDYAITEDYGIQVLKIKKHDSFLHGEWSYLDESGSGYEQWDKITEED